VVDAHLFAAAHADDHIGGAGGGAGGEPDVHDADFDHGGAVGCGDDGGEGDALLEDVIVAVVGGDGFELSAGGPDDDAEAGEAVEGFENPVFGVGGELGELVEEVGGRDGGVVEPGEGELR